jgi:hypothetical protein
MQGMTVIEVAVTTTLLGIVLFFALKGTAVIETMKSVALGYELQQFQRLVLGYQVQYRELPGDDPLAPRRFGREIALVNRGDVRVALSGNGTIDGLFFDGSNPDGEQFAAWRDLRFMGAVAGDPKLTGISSLPETPFGGFYGFDEGNLGQDGGSLCATKVPGRAAELIDKRLDDGRVNSGKLVATSKFSIEQNNHFGAPDTAPYDVEKEYIICVPLLP